MHEMAPCSGLTCMYGMMMRICDDILYRIVDVHSSQTRVCRNGCAMIAFITEIQEQTDNRGVVCSKWEADGFGRMQPPSKFSSQESRGWCQVLSRIMPVCVIILLTMLVPWVFSNTARWRGVPVL